VSGGERGGRGADPLLVPERDLGIGEAGGVALALLRGDPGEDAVEASNTIRVRARLPSTSAKRRGSVRMRCSSTTVPSPSMLQTWVSRLCTSMPMESTAGLLVACGNDRV